MAVRPPSRAPRGKMTRRLAYLQIKRCGPARPPIHGCVSLGPACTQGLSAPSWTPRRHLCRSRIPESPQTRGTRVSRLAGSAGARGPVAPSPASPAPVISAGEVPPSAGRPSGGATGQEEGGLQANDSEWQKRRGDKVE